MFCSAQVGDESVQIIDRVSFLRCIEKSTPYKEARCGV